MFISPCRLLACSHLDGILLFEPWNFQGLEGVSVFLDGWRTKVAPMLVYLRLRLFASTLAVINYGSFHFAKMKIIFSRWSYLIHGCTCVATSQLKSTLYTHRELHKYYRLRDGELEPWSYTT